MESLRERKESNAVRRSQEPVFEGHPAQHRAKASGPIPISGVSGVAGEAR